MCHAALNGPMEAGPNRGSTRRTVLLGEELATEKHVVFTHSVCVASKVPLWLTQSVSQSVALQQVGAGR